MFDVYKKNHVTMYVINVYTKNHITMYLIVTIYSM